LRVFEINRITQVMQSTPYSLGKATWPNAFDAPFMPPSTHRHCSVTGVVVEMIENGWHQAVDGRLTLTGPHNGLAKDCLATARYSHGFSQSDLIAAAL
jgi:hypothetical protein